MEVWQVIEEQRRFGEPMVVVTAASQRGSVPGETGGKAVITRQGLIAGTLGGGRIEAKAISEALAMLDAGPSCVLRVWNLQRDVGMTCGGEMGLLFERVTPTEDWHVVVFGAGHVSQALVRLLATLRCRIDVVDERAEWLERLPVSEKITRHPVSRFEQGVPLVGCSSFVVSITKGHSSDLPVLRDILRLHPAPPFIGVIGSAAKRAVLLRELTEEGITPDRLEKLVCPLGLPLGGNDPAEIAVSIAAQLLQHRDTLKPASDQSPA